jgi:integrase
MEQPPRNGFETRAVKALTLSEVSAALAAAGLAPKRLADLQSAVRKVSAIVGRSPEQVPLELPNLRRTLKQGAPGTEGLSKKTLQNLRSNLGAAIEASGLKKILRTAAQQLTSEWEAVLPAIKRKGPRTCLCRLSRFCSAKGIAPSAINDAVFAAKTLTSIAREWVRASPEHIDELKRLRSKLPGLETGLSKKNKQVLIRLDDPAVLGALLDLPGRLMSRALSDRCPGKRRLPMVQVALMLEFLLHIPLRISDLTKLRFGENIGWPAGPKGPACLALSIEKTGEPFQAELDGELAAMLKSYREKLVPKLTGQRHDELFVSVDGRLKLPATLSVEFKRAMIEHLGFAITPHQFRHIAAKLILDHNPGAFELIRQLLGHTSQKYAISNYAGVDTNRAVRHHDKLIQDMRAQRKLPRKKSKPPKEQD